MRLQSSNEAPNSSFTLLKEELSKQIPRISLLVALALIGTVSALIPPYLFKLLIDTAIPTADVRLIGRRGCALLATGNAAGAGAYTTPDGAAQAHT